MQSHCKVCTSTWHKEVYSKTDRAKQLNRIAASKCNAKLRAEMIEAYGGRCECCGETEAKFLSIDHIGGGGQEHRNEIGEGGNAIARYLRRNNYPKDKFRLLCFNCNCAIGFFGACPHNQSLDTLIECASKF